MEVVITWADKTWLVSIGLFGYIASIVLIAFSHRWYQAPVEVEEYEAPGRAKASQPAKDNATSQKPAGAPGSASAPMGVFKPPTAAPAPTTGPPAQDQASPKQQASNAAVKGPIARGVRFNSGLAAGR